MRNLRTQHGTKHFLPCCRCASGSPRRWSVAPRGARSSRPAYEPLVGSKALLTISSSSVWQRMQQTTLMAHGSNFDLCIGVPKRVRRMPWNPTSVPCVGTRRHDATGNITDGYATFSTVPPVGSSTELLPPDTAS